MGAGASTGAPGPGAPAGRPPPGPGAPGPGAPGPGARGVEHLEEDALRRAGQRTLGQGSSSRSSSLERPPADEPPAAAPPKPANGANGAANGHGADGAANGAANGAGGAAGKQFVFDVFPMSENLQRHKAGLRLEVTGGGFRLLRLATDDAVHAFPFPQIHSWAHSHNTFSFRYYMEKSKRVDSYIFSTANVDQILACIHDTVDTILSERKRNGIPPEDMAKLLDAIKSTGGDVVERVKTAATMNYFTSEQAYEIAQAMEDDFDRIEVICTLHANLIDQHHFSKVLTALASPEDKENVWQRIKIAKKGGASRF